MAKVIESFPSSTVPSKYPWDEWLDGKIWHLEQGTDFESSVPSLISAAHAIAKRRRGTVRTKSLSNGTVILQFKGKKAT